MGGIKWKIEMFMQFITLLGYDVFKFNSKPNKRQEGLKDRNQLHHQPNIGLFQKLEAPHKEEKLRNSRA